MSLHSISYPSPTTRHAINTDAGAVVDLLRQSHAAARWSFPFDPARAHALFTSHIQTNRACALVLEVDGQVSGLLMASLFEHPFGAGVCATETVWFIKESARGKYGLTMLDAYEAWAKQSGCASVCMASLAINDVSSIYTRRGYEPVETHFMKELSQ